MSPSERLLAAEHSLDLLTSTSQKTGIRRDTRRNRRRLLAAGSELVREGGVLTMHRIAELADTSIATAYRHFSSVDELIYAYVRSVAEDMANFSAKTDAKAEHRMSLVLGHWIALAQQHGHVMVNHRSRRGFLQRLHEDDPVVSLIAQAWKEPIEQFMAAKGIDLSLTTHATFLCNQMFDPRDVLDLLQYGETTPETLVHRLLDSFEGALRGWGA